MSEWIDVMKAKPPLAATYGDLKKKPYVLAVDVKGRMSVGYAISTPYGYRWTFAKPIGEPTHWMLLPEPPKL